MKNQQRATTFMPGTFSQVCREIGFKYGYALVEGYQQLPIITMAMARRAIKELVSREIINPDQAQGLTDAIAKAGVAEDAAAIIRDINVKWEDVVAECRWQSQHADPRFCVFLYDFLDELVHQFSISLPATVVKEIKKMYRQFMESLEPPEGK